MQQVDRHFIFPARPSTTRDFFPVHNTNKASVEAPQIHCNLGKKWHFTCPAPARQCPSILAWRGDKPQMCPWCLLHRWPPGHALAKALGEILLHLSCYAGSQIRSSILGWLFATGHLTTCEGTSWQCFVSSLHSANDHSLYLLLLEHTSNLFIMQLSISEHLLGSLNTSASIITCLIKYIHSLHWPIFPLFWFFHPNRYQPYQKVAFPCCNAKDGIYGITTIKRDTLKLNTTEKYSM